MLSFLPLENWGSVSLGQWAKGVRTVGGTLGPVWVVPSSFEQALLIYAKHMQTTRRETQHHWNVRRELGDNPAHTPSFHR
jgi:hypothetical protein